MSTLLNMLASTSQPNSMLTNIALASAGGYADAASYLLAGSFTGHLTGNTVLSAIALGGGDWHKIVLPVLAVALFLCGTVTGLSIGQLDGRGIRPLLVALPLEAILIACASMSRTLHTGDHKVMIVACLCLALEIQNGVFRKADRVSVHATYVTGDVTSLVAAAFGSSRATKPQASGESKSGGRGASLRILGSTWLSFSMGALLSVLMVHRLGISALWLLEAFIVLAALSSWKPLPIERRFAHNRRFSS